jgi:hypothetical protein
LISPDSSKKPTLFLLDDVLSSMHGVRTRNKELKERRRTTANNNRGKFLLEADVGNSNVAGVSSRNSSIPAGRAASAAKALLKMQELEKENENMKKLRRARREDVVKKEPENLTRESINNYRKDKEFMERAVKRKLAKDKEDAERAKTEPPPEFVARISKKAQEEAQTAAFAKGKSAREAMTLGKAAYQSVQEKYRKQGLTAEQRDEEAEEEDRIMMEKLREEERINKVPMMATDSAAGARLGIKGEICGHKRPRLGRRRRRRRCRTLHLPHSLVTSLPPCLVSSLPRCLVISLVDRCSLQKRRATWKLPRPGRISMRRSRSGT